MIDFGQKKELKAGSSESLQRSRDRNGPINRVVGDLQAVGMWDYLRVRGGKEGSSLRSSNR